MSKISSVCSLFFFPLISSSQTLPTSVLNEIDSLNVIIGNSKDVLEQGNAHLKIAEHYLHFDPDSSQVRLELAEVIFRGVGNREGIADCESYYGILAEGRGDLEQALVHYRKALHLYYQENILGGVVAGFFNIGGIYFYQGDMMSALDFFYRGLKISERIGDKESIFTALANIATVFENQGELDKSLNFRLRSLKLAIELESPEKIGDTKGSLGSVYRFKMQHFIRENGSIDSILYYKTQSLHFYSESYLLARENGNRRDEGKIGNAIGLLHKSWAQYLEKQGAVIDSINASYNLAFDFFSRTLSIDSQIKDLRGMAYANQYMADIYLKQGNSERALWHAEESMRLSREIGFTMNIKQSANQLYLVYKDAGEFEKALDMYVLSIEMRDSMTNATTEKETLKKEFEYELEKHEYEQDILKNEQEIQELRLTQQRSVMFGLVLFFLLVAMVTILFVRNRFVRHRHRTGELEQQLLRSQMNPHFIFNSLNSIQRMYVEGSVDQANDYMGDFSTLLRRILENSSKRYITLKEELDTLKVYLEMEKIRTAGIINYTIEVGDELDVYNFKVPPLIIQPFVENAIWHAIIPSKRAGEINIEISKKDQHHLLCTIRDNGIGFGNAKTSDMHNSKGINLSRERLGSQNSVTIENIDGGGTQVSLKISIVK